MPALESLTAGGALTPTSGATAAGGTLNTGASTINFGPAEPSALGTVNKALVIGGGLAAVYILARAFK